MADAYVFDAVRTPRGKGKKDGSLHEVPAVRLGAKVLEALRDRNGLDTGSVDDIIFGCVDPVGEAGSVIPRAAAFEAGYDTKAPGMQLSRFCASGLDAINLGAAKIAQGADDIVIAGGVESMSRVGMGASGGAWFMDPSVGFPGWFVPQGISADLIATKHGFSRDDVDVNGLDRLRRSTVLVLVSHRRRDSNRSSSLDLRRLVKSHRCARLSSRAKLTDDRARVIRDPTHHV